MKLRRLAYGLSLLGARQGRTPEQISKELEWKARTTRSEATIGAKRCLSCIPRLGSNLIRQQGALNDVKRGSAGLESALYKCRSSWASFPASPHNQPRKKLSELKNVYIQALLKYQGQSPALANAATVPVIKDKAQPQTVKSQVADKVQTKPQEDSQKGCEIIVELGYSLDQMVAFHFIHLAPPHPANPSTPPYLKELFGTSPDSNPVKTDSQLFSYRFPSSGGMSGLFWRDRFLFGVGISELDFRRESLPLHHRVS